jgi:phosphoribosylamine--glycine ligase
VQQWWQSVADTPATIRKNLLISGLAERNTDDGTIVFHAGTKEADDDTVVPMAEGCLAVTSYGETISEAVATSKAVLEKISFEGMYFRRDIGYEFEEA